MSLTGFDGQIAEHVTCTQVAASPTADVRTKDLVGLLSGCLLSPLPTHAPAESRARRERALRALLD